MQAKKLSEHEWVSRCMTELCAKAGFADCGDLVQRDLEFLCKSIELKTGVLISLSTMRRLLKGEFSRIPQVATLNAMAAFLGYPSWQDYKLKKEEEPGLGPPDHAAKKNTNSSTPVRLSKKWIGVAGGILVVVAAGLIALLNPAASLPPDPGTAAFSVTKTTDSDLPNTVVFNYNIENVKADSFFIQQSWDKNRRVKIDKNSHTLTDIYYEPGYHIAKLMANDQVIKTLDVSIPTDKWFFYSKERTPRSTPVYIHSSYQPGDEALAVNKEDLVKSGVDIQQDNEYLYVYFPSAITISSDSYILRCKIKVNGIKNDFCPFFMCEIFCQKNFMFFTSMPKGCASEIMAQFGENFISGKNNDLTQLAADVSQWQDVELRVKDKSVTIRINETPVFSATYNESGGMITGLGFISNGLCEVKDIDFTTPDGSAIIDTKN